MEGVPLGIFLRSLFVNVLPETDEPNYSKGEIVKFNFVKSCRNNTPVGKQVVTSNDGYDGIWISLGNDWFKCIGKYKQSQFSCQ